MCVCVVLVLVLVVVVASSSSSSSSFIYVEHRQSLQHHATPTYACVLLLDGWRSSQKKRRNMKPVQQFNFFNMFWSLTSINQLSLPFLGALRSFLSDSPAFMDITIFFRQTIELNGPCSSIFHIYKYVYVYIYEIFSSIKLQEGSIWFTEKVRKWPEDALSPGT